VRQAIVHAINNEGIFEKIMKGTATVAAQQSPSGYMGHEEDLKPRFDLEKAKALMKEAGLENGFECTMIAPNNRHVNDEKIKEKSRRRSIYPPAAFSMRDAIMPGTFAVVRLLFLNKWETITRSPAFSRFSNFICFPLDIWRSLLWPR
jgi:ABC-type transport system substrate-binding protein